MKNLIKSVLFVATLCVAPMTLCAGAPEQPTTVATYSSQGASSRIEEIKAMDKSGMSAKEKRALRREIRAMKNDHTSGGIYLSAGAVILIVILLIILL